VAGYRFCRTDDLPLLVETHNACWLPWFPSERPLTLEDLKRDIRELNVWGVELDARVRWRPRGRVLIGASASTRTSSTGSRSARATSAGATASTC